MRRSQLVRLCVFIVCSVQNSDWSNGGHNPHTHATHTDTIQHILSYHTHTHHTERELFLMLGEMIPKLKSRQTRSGGGAEASSGGGGTQGGGASQGGAGSKRKKGRKGR